MTTRTSTTALAAFLLAAPSLAFAQTQGTSGAGIGSPSPGQSVSDPGTTNGPVPGASSDIMGSPGFSSPGSAAPLFGDPSLNPGGMSRTGQNIPSIPGSAPLDRTLPGSAPPASSLPGIPSPGNPTGLTPDVQP